MIYIVKQWRYKWEDSYVFELEATYKAFESREKAIEYIESDIDEKSIDESILVEYNFSETVEIFHGKYGDKYQIIKTKLL